MYYIVCVYSVYRMYVHGTPICLLIRIRDAYCIENYTYLIKMFLSWSKQTSAHTSMNMFVTATVVTVVVDVFFYFIFWRAANTALFYFSSRFFLMMTHSMFSFALDIENSMGKIETVLVGRW